MSKVQIKRGDIVSVDFGSARGVCKAGRRSALVVQNDKGNAVSPMTVVVPLTDVRQFKNLPIQVEVTTVDAPQLEKDSCVECGHVTAIDRACIDDKAGVLAHLKPSVMAKVDRALRVSLGL